MRRYVYLVLFVLVLLAPFVLRQVVLRGRGNDPGLGSAGAGKDVGRLVVVTPHSADILREFGRAFPAWHRQKYGSEAVLDFRVPGASNDIKRLLDTAYRGLRSRAGGGAGAELPPDAPIDYHVVWGGGDPMFRDLMKFEHGSVLSPVGLDPQRLAEIFPEPELAGVPLYDPSKDAAGLPRPQWVGVCLSRFGIVYNPDVYAALALPPPQRWDQLTDERLAGRVALADPTHSGSAAVTYMVILQRAMATAEEAVLERRPELKPLDLAARAKDKEYAHAVAAGWRAGMGQLLLIAANARYFTDNATQVPTDVANGDAAAGMAIDFYGIVTEQIVGAGRARFVAPPAATAVTPDPVAILAGVKGAQRELAEHFVEFLLSPEGQRMWVLKPGQPGGPRDRALGRTPIRRDVYRDRNGWAHVEDPFAQTGGFNLRRQWMNLYGDIQPLWAAAWIDSRGALKDAYGEILEVPDATKRAALVAELSRLPTVVEDRERPDRPLEMADVEALQAELRKVQRARQLQKERGRVETRRELAEAMGAAASEGEREVIAGFIAMLDELAIGDGRAVSPEEWKARKRMEWAGRFRRHYAAVAEKAQASGG